MYLSIKKIWLLICLTLCSLLSSADDVVLAPATIDTATMASATTDSITASSIPTTRFTMGQTLKVFRSAQKKNKKENNNLSLNNLEIKNLNISHPTKLITNLNLYAGWGLGWKMDYWQSASAATSLYPSTLDLGLSVEMRTPSMKTLHFGVNLGYEYKRIGTDINLFSLYGIDTHWLKPEVFLDILFIRFGIASDIFLASQVRNTPKFTYNGIYNDCFNPVLPSVFMGYNIAFSFVRLEGRLNFCIINPINAEKVAMHTYQRVSVGADYSFSLRLCVPLLTQENKILSLFPASLR